MTQRQRQRGSADSWTPARLAAEIGMSVKFVRTEISLGEVRAVKLGREYRIPYAEVQRYCKTIGWPVPDRTSST
jgi:excisionase family DNA binding protein